MRTFFLSTKEEKANLYPLLTWLHECISPNKRGRAYDWDVHSDGSSYTCWRGKDNLWEVSRQGDVVVNLHEDYLFLYILRWK